MSIEQIKNVLKEKIGLYAESIGESSVQRAIDIRLLAHEMKNTADYFDMLNNSRVEFDALVEEIIVPETWFFRYQQSFDFISAHLASKIRSQNAAFYPLRILSFPCSTGEEPYSILIQLSEDKLSLQNIFVDAIDISKRSLKKAKQGCFGNSAFKETSDDIKQRYFSVQKNDYQIKQELRDKVSFKHRNFLVGSLSPKPAYYDVILCRNLLIYFDSELQQLAMEKLYRALKPDGLLILGHAESSTLNSQYFTRTGDECAHAFHRVNPVSKKSNISARGIFTGSSNDRSSLPEIKALNQQYDGVGEISLRLIESLVKKSQYYEAESLIEKRLQITPGDPSAYFFLALIRYHMGEMALSESLLRKTIYLDPNHQRSMTLLITIAKKGGDRDSVLKYERRLNRITAKNNR